MVVLSSLHDSYLATLLHHGRVGVIPTDTIYGLAARAVDRAAVARLYRLKLREQKPGTIIAANITQLIGLGIEANSLHKVAHLWPNPISVVLPAAAGIGYLHQDVGSLAVRIPVDEEVRFLVKQIGPLLTSSANMPNESPATTIAEAQAYFGSKVDFYVDGGGRHNRPPSTVVRFADGRFDTLRQGAVTIDEEGNIV
ncbi:MAG TPA: Sua5/YciO/YrdC/YwlC family protein [Candidatus Saccharimonadales bacterium]|nr:Sua5/YciO/YrdC/YwlC family protein [Candidatus Saccharimonadales bacterium]